MNIRIYFKNDYVLDLKSRDGEPVIKENCVFGINSHGLLTAVPLSNVRKVIFK